MGAQINIDFLKMFENDWLLLSDLTDFVFGGCIGIGNSRTVYDFKIGAPGRYVVKIDRTGHFNNVAEWEIWNNFKDHKEFSEFLCPCVKISSCGRLLIQEKTKPVTLEEMPKEIPNFFHDFKIQNWGKIGKKIVCHDYANHSFYRAEKVEMFEPHWWSDSYQVIDGK